MVVPTPRVFPSCQKCSHTNFESHQTTFKKVSVLIIYCSSCGTVAGVVNVPENKAKQ